VRSAGAASKTHDGRHTDMPVRQDVPHVLHQPLHTPPPLKMKQNRRCPACSDPNTTPGRSSGARLQDAWETEENLSVDPGMAAAIRSGSKDQVPARQSADALDKDLTNSERQGMGGCRGKWISTRQAGSLETHC
jgi:hypothetical protein